MAPFIFKVPTSTLEENAELYTPKIIGFGPWHGSIDVKNLKQNYQMSFLCRINKTFQEVQHETEGIRDEIAECYGGLIINTIQEKDQFTHRMATDGCVMLEILLKKFHQEESSKSFADKVLHDLVLLENQLPMMLLEKIYRLRRILTPSLSELVFGYFNCYNTKNIPHQDINAKHFIDLMRSFLLPSWIDKGYKIEEHGQNQVALAQIYNLSKLKHNGVEVKIAEEKSWLDVEFQNRELRLPRFVIDELTEARLKNLLVFEESFYPESPYVSDHFYMLKSLVRTVDDVNLLHEEKILVYMVDNPGIVLNIIASLGTVDYFKGMDQHLSAICQALNDFHDNPDNKSKAWIRREFCNSTCQRIYSTVIVVGFVAYGVYILFFGGKNSLI